MNRRPRNLSVVLVPIAVLLLLVGCGTNPDKAYDRALRAFEQGDWIGASLYAREFINKFPEDPRLRNVYNLLVNCHLRLGDWALARSVCDEIVEHFPNEQARIDADLVRGRTYFGEGNVDRALATFSQVADSTAAVWNRLRAIDEAAFAYQFMAGRTGSSTASEWARAESAYDDWLALAASPEAASDIPDITAARASVLERRASIWRHAGDFRKAADAFGFIAAATGVPDLERAKWSLQRSVYLQFLSRSGDPDAPLTPEARQELIDSYQQTVQNFPETDFGVWSRVELCKLYKPIDQEKAEKYLTEGIERYQKYVENPAEPGMLQFYMTKIGDAYFHVEDITRAEKAFLDLRNTFPDKPDVLEYTSRKLQTIREIRAKSSEKPSDATKAVEAPTPSEG